MIRLLLVKHILKIILQQNIVPLKQHGPLVCCNIFFASLKKQERIIAFVKVPLLYKREIVPLSEILTLLLILKNNESSIKLLFLIQNVAY